MISLYLWQHRTTGARYLVLATDSGPQLATGPLSVEELQAVQVDETQIRWRPGLADQLVLHAEAYDVVWPVKKPTPAASAWQ